MTELEGAQPGSSQESTTRVLQVELLISNLLRIGVVSSLAFVVAGLLLLGVGVLTERGRRYVIKAMEADHEVA